MSICKLMVVINIKILLIIFHWFQSIPGKILSKCNLPIYLISLCRKRRAAPSQLTCTWCFTTINLEKKTTWNSSKINPSMHKNSLKMSICIYDSFDNNSRIKNDSTKYLMESGWWCCDGNFSNRYFFPAMLSAEILLLICQIAFGRCEH